MCTGSQHWAVNEKQRITIHRPQVRTELAFRRTSVVNCTDQLSRVWGKKSPCPSPGYNSFYYFGFPLSFWLIWDGTSCRSWGRTEHALKTEEEKQNQTVLWLTVLEVWWSRQRRLWSIKNKRLRPVSNKAASLITNKQTNLHFQDKLLVFGIKSSLIAWEAACLGSWVLGIACRQWRRVQTQ